MRIVNWKGNGALRRKTDFLEQLKADIYVVQECQNPAESTSSYLSWSGSYLWTGASKNKGVGVFAEGDVQVEALNWNRVVSNAGSSQEVSLRYVASL